MAEMNAFLALAILLTVGVIGTRLAHRCKLPGVTGQILAGVMVGHSGLSLIGEDALGRLGIVTDFALAFIAISIGSHLGFHRLHNAGKRLFLLLLTESLITPAITLAVLLTFSDAPMDLALLLSAMAISTAPATILAIIRETRSKGAFVKTLVAAVALNNVACILTFEVVRVLLRGSEGQGPWGDVLLLPMAALVGIACGLGLVLLSRRITNVERLATISLTTLLAAAGLSSAWGLSTMLTCLAMGATLSNLSPRGEKLGSVAIGSLEGAIFTTFFTLAGAHLDFGLLVTAGSLALAVLVGRVMGKLLAAYLAMHLAQTTDRIRRCLGYALIPQAGVAIGLVLIILQDPAFAHLQQTILSVGLTTVMVNEIIGPIFTRKALEASGDYGRNRPRVIDFIQEEHIEMDLEASTKNEAIAKLVDLLIKTQKLDVQRSTLLESVVKREAEASTCIGGGLWVPHARLEGQDEIAGVIGISREGMNFDTPDGKPVHCMVLLATSDSLNDRHLKVLSALARAMSAHHDIGHTLFTAKSSAHVYELLHAERSDGFNVFLKTESEAPVTETLTAQAPK